MFPIDPTIKAKNAQAIPEQTVATIFSPSETGVMSPYPIVVNVVKAQNYAEI
jgi:hypothetical protein